MATAYCKTRNAKSSDDQTLVPDWDDIWAHHKKTLDLVTVESMNADGWKTYEQVGQLFGVHRMTVANWVNTGRYDSRKEKTRYKGCIREVNFVRPKIH